MSNTIHLYTDGGLCLESPSCYGGAWAWCLVVDSAIVGEGSGDLFPSEVGGTPISCNMVEFAAICEGLSMALNHPACPGQKVTVCSDSLNALNWWQKLPTPGAYHNHLYARAQDAAEMVDIADVDVSVLLLKGHPTKAELAQGFHVKRSGRQMPVSAFNVRCDEVCTRRCQKIAEEAMARLKKAKTPSLTTPIARCLPAPVPALALASAKVRQISLLELEGV